MPKSLKDVTMENVPLKLTLQVDSTTLIDKCRNFLSSGELEWKKAAEYKRVATGYICPFVLDKKDASTYVSNPDHMHDDLAFATYTLRLSLDQVKAALRPQPAADVVDVDESC